MTNKIQNTPIIILIEPQMGENIGAAARGMLNCGVSELRIVNPRDGWPNERAETMSSGALGKMPPVRVFDTTAEAVADCHYIYATTARPRDMEKPVFTARSAADDARTRTAQGQKIAFLFGPERTGLTNDDMALSHAAVTIPLNPDFASLNLGQAVLLLAYEWSQSALSAAPHENPLPAPHAQLNELFDRFESELEAHHFFRNEGQKPIVIRNLRTALARAEMTDQEIRTFHGIISALIGRKNPPLAK